MFELFGNGSRRIVPVDNFFENGSRRNPVELKSRHISAAVCTLYVLRVYSAFPSHSNRKPFISRFATNGTVLRNSAKVVCEVLW